MIKKGQTEMLAHSKIWKPNGEETERGGKSVFDCPGGS